MRFCYKPSPVTLLAADGPRPLGELGAGDLDLGFFSFNCAAVKLLSCTVLSCKPPGHVMSAAEHQSVHHTGQGGTNSPSESLELNGDRDIGSGAWTKAMKQSRDVRGGLSAGLRAHCAAQRLAPSLLHATAC